MLKIVNTAISLALMSSLPLAFAQAEVSDALQNICTIVKADDKAELRQKMKRVQSDYKLSLKDYYSGITCGGNSLIRTAMLSNAVETGTLMVKKMPKGDLSSPEQDGKTVIAWAQEKGLADSPILAALKSRI
ncbi:DUF3718 domain-containing protein [Paraglaciecola aestuariivivens]